MRIVTGAASGIGLELSNIFISKSRSVLGLDIKKPGTGDKWQQCDVSRSESFDSIPNRPNKAIDGIINCVGINHIQYLDQLSDYDVVRLYRTNVVSFLNTYKAFKNNLVDGSFICNIISNASHIPMTASFAYNASKGAAATATLQMARELAPRGIRVFGISPNKLKGTEMSRYIANTVPVVRGWTPEYSEEYQKKSLFFGDETDPKTVAKFIDYLTSDFENYRYLSGCIIPYGA